MRKSIIACISVAVVMTGAFAGAESHISDRQISNAIKARKSHMQLYSFHLGTLGGMAKGDAPYDAEAASAAADSLVALAGLPQSGYWLPGSDNANAEDTRALPAIWEAGSDIGAKGQAFGDAVMAMQAAAGTDLDALKAAMGPLGKSCGGCHEGYRQSNN